MRRRNAATECSRSSSALSAVTSVRRARRFSDAGAGRLRCRQPDARHRRRRGAGAAPLPPRPPRGRARRGHGRAAGLASSRRSASWRPPRPWAWFRPRAGGALFVALARFGGFALDALDRLSRASRIRASSSAILRSSASRRRASPSACARASRSSSVRVRSTTPDGLVAGRGVGAGAARPPCRGARPCRRRGRLPAGAAAGAAASALAPCRACGFHLFDDHRLGAAMAETLAHHALLDAAPFQRQRLARS